MGPDNTPDITSHHLHNLYHRFIRRQSFEKSQIIKALKIYLNCDLNENKKLPGLTCAIVFELQ